MNNTKSLKEYADSREQAAYADLSDALERCKSGKTNIVKVRGLQKITPSMVAREANRSRSILYSTHTDLLDEIERINKRRGGSRRTKRLENERKESNLRETVKLLNKDKAALAQENYRLQLEIDELRNKMKRITRLKL